MSSADAFARDCEALAKAMRTLSSEVQSELDDEVQTQIAEPLGQRIADASRGKWAHALSQSVEVHAGSAGPEIVVGGTRRLVSGGATGRQLIWGTEEGGGGRVSSVRSSRGRAYKRHTTRQFRPAAPFVFDTVEDSVPWVMDRYAEIVMKKVNAALG